jgi:hypothetical protein
VLDGNRKGDTVMRTVGDDHEVRAFATYGAVAIALIGTLPDTLHDRSLVIDLKRRLAKEKVTPFRFDRAAHLDVLARKAARWAADNAERVAASDPKMPNGIINREADNWRPLLAVADAACGRWPQRARWTATKAHVAAVTGDEASRLELLLGDIRDVFDGLVSDKDRISSAHLIERLVEIVPRPWAEYGRSGKPLTQNKLARLLKPLGIVPQKIRIGIETPNGYHRHQFQEAWDRFLSTEGGSQPEHRNKCNGMGTSDGFQSGTAQTDVPVQKCEKSNNDGLCSSVPVAKGENGAKAHMRTAKPRSDDLPYRGPVVAVPNLPSDALDEHGVAVEPEPGISRRRIEWFAEQYTERAYANAAQNDGDTRTAELDAWLRHALAEDGVLPEFVEVEFERVMDMVFRV